MTESKRTPQQEQDEQQVIHEPVQEDAPEVGYDPITAPNSDPAAMSEHERNIRQAEQHNAGL